VQALAARPLFYTTKVAIATKSKQLVSCAEETTGKTAWARVVPMEDERT
jgi:hypothetical protein